MHKIRWPFRCCFFSQQMAALLWSLNVWLINKKYKKHTHMSQIDLKKGLLSGICGVSHTTSMQTSDYCSYRYKKNAYFAVWVKITTRRFGPDSLTSRYSTVCESLWCHITARWIKINLHEKSRQLVGHVVFERTRKYVGVNPLAPPRHSSS